ncbi:Uncharacterized conserved protein YbbK, DUF523 family [Thermosyntropha lipolytica DSM 11003]|uniref:Uncharacterized conserved protein YbbK, DUF523 family n=1 Tax=Thermosyntropha lipolytica DSM 11003 TaxID=1123382 RepID=A0A1M5LAS7_9FIRM|nr:DUF523 domain-containing protein [Thermosyntropha lipolytica]SHG62080.1 Uncharacterized conserved protein YbbK, DUF523 family [Thermosyntropha lipolytica DSM 11003]
MNLISACLCGYNCKYNGKNNFHPLFKELLDKGEFIPVCPEELGGLPTPRPPAEIQNGTGIDVLKGKAKVINKKGEDVSSFFIKGAYITLQKAWEKGAVYAILKSRSPSCGAGQIYDGSFNSVLREGDGVTAALLKQHGIKVITEEEYLKGEYRL